MLEDDGSHDDEFMRRWAEEDLEDMSEDESGGPNTGKTEWTPSGGRGVRAAAKLRRAEVVLSHC